MSSDLTKRQSQIMDFIHQEIARKGYPPSVREIGQAVGLSSSSTVHSHLAALEKKGFIRRDPTKPRALETLDYKSAKPGNGSRAVHLPLLGQVAAGMPILAQENVEDMIAVPVELVKDESSFLLRVRGESMIEAGILDGDILIVRQQQTADNGDIVVAMIEDEATVKRFSRYGDRIVLKPENRLMEPIISRDVTVIGKVTGLFRII
ncbi:MAG: transcriptional repressor LexA [Candidatus Aquicultorales bacterium]